MFKIIYEIVKILYEFRNKYAQKIHERIKVPHTTSMLKTFAYVQNCTVGNLPI